MTRWADMDDDGDRLYTTEEVKEIVKKWMPFNDSASEKEGSPRTHCLIRDLRPNLWKLQARTQRCQSPKTL